MSTPKLGVAESYEVFITGYYPHQEFTRVPFSTASWQRRLSEPSEASVEGEFYTSLFNGEERARPWSHGLRIERIRSGEPPERSLVWWGPIRQIHVDPNTRRATIRAIDAMALCARRRIKANGPDDTDPRRKQLTLRNRDVAAVFGRLVQEAMQPDLRGLIPPAFDTGILTTRVYKIADYEMIASQIQELEPVLRWSVVAHELVGVGTEGIAGSSLAYGGDVWPSFGPFNNKAFSEQPSIDEIGDEQATEVIIPGADNGEEGFRQSWRAARDSTKTGELSRVVPSSFFRPTEDADTLWDQFFSTMAVSMLNSWYETPIQISGGSVTPDAPLAINEMIPGTAWTLDLETAGKPLFTGIQMLESLDVDVTKDGDGRISEGIRPTLSPLSKVALVL